MAPKVLLNKRNHRVVTDQEDVQERNWMNKGKVGTCLLYTPPPQPFVTRVFAQMQNERIKTEEHIEYDSDDSKGGSSSSSSNSSHHKVNDLGWF